MIRTDLAPPADIARSIDTEEGKLHYLDVGHGDPLLLIHAFGPQPGVTSWMIYREVIEELFSSYRCIALDMPNFGLTGPVTYNEPFHDVVVRAAIRLLDHLQIECLPVIGTSMGATVAIDMALQAPRRVKAMVIGACHASTGGDPYVLTPFPSEVLRLHTEAQLRPDDPKALERLLRAILYDTSLVTPHLIDAIQAFQRQHHDHWAAETQSTSVPHSNLDKLRQITIPTHIVHGRFDRMVPVEQALLISGYLPQADITILNHCGHWPSVERPQAFRAAVAGFLGSLT